MKLWYSYSHTRIQMKKNVWKWLVIGISRSVIHSYLIHEILFFKGTLCIVDYNIDVYYNNSRRNCVFELVIWCSQTQVK